MYLKNRSGVERRNGDVDDERKENNVVAYYHIRAPSSSPSAFGESEGDTMTGVVDFVIRRRAENMDPPILSLQYPVRLALY